jgi:hypothetical protein
VATRREFLRVGGLSLFGLGLPDLLALQAQSQVAPSTFGKARACILLFMWGGPAQQETWDLKPEAPEQVRGEFRPIATRVPGIQICEHFPKLAQRADRLAIIRSMHHSDVNHTTATHELLTGWPIPRGTGRFEEDWPHYGAVLHHLGVGPERAGALPPFAQLRPTIPNAAPRFVEQSHGQGGGWLSPGLRPFTIDHDPSLPDYTVQVGEFRLPVEVAPTRLTDRRSLLNLVDQTTRHWDDAVSAQAMSEHQSRACELLTSGKAREAFDLSKEDPRLRERYGLHAHGQSVLQARRLVEAGVPLVTVFWQNDGIENVSVYWDTHNRNFIDLKTRLMPPADQAFSALLDDLEARGLLDETLIVWTGEFGRTPRVGQGVVGGAGAGRDGRDHWPHCFSTAYPARDPVTPADVAATIYHMLGVDPALELRDALDRPMRLSAGEPIRAILA